MIEIYYKAINYRKIKTLDNFKIGSWIYVEAPSDKELKFLAKKFSLELGLLTDATDPHEVPRLEIDGGVIYIFTRVPYQENTKVRIITVPVLIVIGENFLITICQKNLPFLKKFIEGKIDFSTTQKTKLLLQIFSQINTAYNAFLTAISRQVRSISVQLENIQNRDIVCFVTFEAILNDFLAALVPTNAILENLLSGKILKLYVEDKELIEDLFLSNRQLIELSKANLKNIVNIRDAYSTIMTNNLSQIVKFLTALTIILNVPMIISSFYGMNVKLPLAGSPIAFWQLLISTLMISLVLLIIFIKNRWL